MADHVRAPMPAEVPEERGKAAAGAGERLFSPRVERITRVAFWGGGLLWLTLLGYAWGRNPDLHHGDAYSDANVLLAGRNFDAFGLGLNWGLPAHSATHTPDRPARPYTHYPPGPEWIHQLLKACGLHELWQWRLASWAFAVAAVLCAARVFMEVTGSAVLGRLAALIYSVSVPFSQYADSLHQHTYMQLTLFACALAWTRYERQGASAGRRCALVGCMLLFFVDLWITMEHILWIPFFLVGRVLYLRRRDLLPGAVLVSLMVPTVLGLRLIHNGVALGSLRAAAQDLFGAAARRSGVSTDAPWSWVIGVWQRRLGRETSAQAQEFAYPLLNPSVAGSAVLLLLLPWMKWRDPRVRILRGGLLNAAVMLLAGLAWFVVMREHSLIHRHVIMLLLPGIALLLATAVGCGLAIGSLTEGRGAGRRLVGWALTAALIGSLALHLRHSRAVNLLVPLDPTVRGRIVADRQRAEALRAAAEGLANATRIYFVGGRYPTLYYAIGRPFERRPGQDIPERLEPGETVWIEYWSEEEKQAAAVALQLFGMPNLLPPPNLRSLIFESPSPPAAPADVLFEGGYRLTALRCVPSLDGGWWLVQALLELPPEHRPEALEEVVVFVWILDCEARAVTSIDSRLSWGIRAGQQVLVSTRVARSALPCGTRFRIGLWDTRANRALPIDRAVSTLPSGAQWAEPGVELLCDTPIGDREASDP